MQKKNISVSAYSYALLSIQKQTGRPVNDRVSTTLYQPSSSSSGKVFCNSINFCLKASASTIREWLWLLTINVILLTRKQLAILEHMPVGMWGEWLCNHVTGNQETQS